MITTFIVSNWPFGVPFFLLFHCKYIAKDITYMYSLNAFNYIFITTDLGHTNHQQLQFIIIIHVCEPFIR